MSTIVDRMSDSLSGGNHTLECFLAKNVSTRVLHPLTCHWSRSCHSLRSNNVENLLWYRLLVHNCARRGFENHAGYHRDFVDASELPPPLSRIPASPSYLSALARNCPQCRRSTHVPKSQSARLLSFIFAMPTAPDV